MPAVHCFLEGFVQGVGFRAFVERQGASLDLTGWVRNRPDGRVESLAQGPADRLEIFLDRLKKGPPGSRVTNFQRDKVPEDPRLNSFRILF